jgi:hypothetical protein
MYYAQIEFLFIISSIILHKSRQNNMFILVLVWPIKKNTINLGRCLSLKFKKIGLHFWPLET